MKCSFMTHATFKKQTLEMCFFPPFTQYSPVRFTNPLYLDLIAFKTHFTQAKLQNRHDWLMPQDLYLVLFLFNVSL